MHINYGPLGLAGLGLRLSLSSVQKTRIEATLSLVLSD